MEKTFKHVSSAVPKLLAPLQDTFFFLILNYHLITIYFTFLYFLGGELRIKSYFPCFWVFSEGFRLARAHDITTCSSSRVFVQLRLNMFIVSLHIHDKVCLFSG